jgi:hypothetical protein
VKARRVTRSFDISRERQPNGNLRCDKQVMDYMEISSRFRLDFGSTHQDRDS